MKDAIERYRVVNTSIVSLIKALLNHCTFQEHALTEDDIHKLIFTKQKGATFWRDVGKCYGCFCIAQVTE
jgi:hypothetical protein